MIEGIVSYETAQLAQTKGFKSRLGLGYFNGNYYNYLGELNGCSLKSVMEKHKPKDQQEFQCISAPTQNLLQKWLREVHSIHIEILLSDEIPYNNYYSRVLNVGKYFTLSHDGVYSESYEECLEKALQEELNKLNNERN